MELLTAPAVEIEAVAVETFEPTRTVIDFPAVPHVDRSRMKLYGWLNGLESDRTVRLSYGYDDRRKAIRARRNDIDLLKTLYRESFRIGFVADGETGMIVTLHPKKTEG